MLFKAKPEQLLITLTDHPIGKPFYAGDIIKGECQVPEYAQLVDVKLSLRGYSQQSVLHKAGSTYGSALSGGTRFAASSHKQQLVVQQHHDFLWQSQILWSAKEDANGKINEKQLKGTKKLGFVFRLPQYQGDARSDLHLPPSYHLPHMFDNSRLEVTYLIQLDARRQGKGKGDKTTTLPIQVHQLTDILPEYEDTVHATASLPLSYNSSSALLLVAGLSAGKRVEVHQEDEGDVILPYSLSLHLSSSSSTGEREPPHQSLLHTMKPKVRAYLTRSLTTRPSQDLGGSEHTFEPEATAYQEIGDRIELLPDTLQIKAGIRVPQGEVSLRTTSADVNYKLLIQVSSNKLASTMILTTPVLIIRVAKDAEPPSFS